MACDDQPCTRTVGKVTDWEKDLKVTKVSRVRRKWFLPDENASGATAEDVPPDHIDPPLLAEIRSEFGPNAAMGSPQGVVLSDFCAEAGLEGCYCKIPDEAQGEPVGRREDDHTKEYDYVIEDTLHSPDWDATPRVVTDQQGNPVTIDPFVHGLELVRDTAGQPAFPIRYIRKTRYHATVSFSLTLDIYTYHGKCRPVSELAEEEEGEQDDHHFVGRQAGPRRQHV